MKAYDSLTPDQAECVERADKAIAATAPQDDIRSDDEKLTDLLADLMHWAHAPDRDWGSQNIEDAPCPFYGCLLMAEDHFREEVGEES